MPQRPVWRGHLRLALVSCPIALYSANHDRGSLHFNLINPATGNRIRMITQDAETGAPLSRSELVKGYEFKKDTYVIIGDEDFESARIDSSTMVKIDKFVDADLSTRSISMRVTTSLRTATPARTSISCCGMQLRAPARLPSRASSSRAESIPSLSCRWAKACGSHAP